MGVGDVAFSDDDDVAVAVGDLVRSIGVCRPEVTVVQSGIVDRGGVVASAEELTNLVAGCVLADLIDCERMAAAVNLKRDLPTIENRHLFGREMVQLVCAGV